MIVTFNRKQYLMPLLKALCNQTYSLSAIIIFDNYGSDGTLQELQKQGYVEKVTQENILTCKKFRNLDFYYFRSSENTGGSGGFASAFTLASGMTFDFIWAMDDDVLPELNCLEEMLKYIDDSACLCVPCRGDDKYNDIAITKYDLQSFWCFRIKKRGCIPFYKITEPYVVVQDMALEGPLIAMSVVKKIGVPNRDYFITYDDTDYAYRAGKITELRYIPSAHLHKQIIPPPASKNFNWRSYYDMRNSVYFDHNNGYNWAVRNVRPLLFILDRLVRSIAKVDFYRIPYILKAYKDGMSGHMGKTIQPGQF